MAKRNRHETGNDDDDDVDSQTSPRKVQRQGESVAGGPISTPSRQDKFLNTPTTTRSILKSSIALDPNSDVEFTPRSTRKVLFQTIGHSPVDPVEVVTAPPRTTPRHDHSARKKSNRILRRLSTGDVDDEDEFGDAIDEVVAREILGEEGEDSSGEEDDEVDGPIDNLSVDASPSKRGRPRAKPVSRKRQRTPSPPPDLPPHELYFFQNRPAANKTSTNTFASHLLLDHESYAAHIRAHADTHQDDIRRLGQLHQRSFDQWLTELDESFNICLYGFGSKRELAMDFALYARQQLVHPHKIIIVNGYAPGVTIRDVLCTIAGILLPKRLKLPAQPDAILDLLLLALSDAATSTKVLLFVHSMDHSGLRKPAAQNLLARLASHNHVQLIATCDSPNFPLLWDVTMLSQFRFAFHDATTFKPYQFETDVVDDVNVLLGRGRRRLGGKDGVGFVLKSLPENARNLFRLLVTEQLEVAYNQPDDQPTSAFDDFSPEDILGDQDEEAAALEQGTPSRRGRGKKKTSKAAVAAPRLSVSVPEGVEYRILYHKAVEEFVCSSELNFRTLLKEFHDHQIIESRKDVLGTERLIVPFRKEELEAILEELV